MQTDQPVNPGHVALSATRAQVDAFHAAAVANGGTDNGPPGLRSDYHPFYYASFAHDPDGNNIECVCHEDPAAPKVSARAAKPARPKAKAKVKAKARKPLVKKATSKKAAAKKPTPKKATPKKKSAKKRR
jgi:hypothetical protein